MKQCPRCGSIHLKMERGLHDCTECLDCTYRDKHHMFEKLAPDLNEPHMITCAEILASNPRLSNTAREQIKILVRQGENRERKLKDDIAELTRINDIQKQLLDIREQLLNLTREPLKEEEKAFHLRSEETLKYLEDHLVNKLKR